MKNDGEVDIYVFHVDVLLHRWEFMRDRMKNKNNNNENNDDDDNEKNEILCFLLLYKSSRELQQERHLW